MDGLGIIGSDCGGTIRGHQKNRREGGEQKNCDRVGGGGGKNMASGRGTGRGVGRANFLKNDRKFKFLSKN